MKTRFLHGIPALTLLLGWTGTAAAATSYSPQQDPVPTNILFLVDNTASMATCWNENRVETNGDGKITDLDKCIPPITDPTTLWRRKSVVDAIRAIVKNADGIRFGLALTDPINPTNPDGIGHRVSSGARDGIIVPLGSSKTEFLTALDAIITGPSHAGTVPVNTSNAVPIAEALDDVREYFEAGSYTTNSTYAGVSPIEFYCQESHVIIITDGVTPVLNGTTNPNPNTDITITSAIANYTSNPSFAPTSATAAGYYNQRLENVASYLANTDLSPVLSNRPNGQYVYTHVLALDYDLTVYQDTAANGLGEYAFVDDPDDLEGELWSIVNSINTGLYVTVPPTVSVDGDQLFLGYFEIKPDRPLYYGHLVAYDIQDDPTAANYGEIDTTATQPSWDAGEILASRFVGQQDIMAEDNNGVGIRDIYTNVDDDEVLDPFDATNLGRLCPMMLDKSQTAGGDYNGVPLGHDIDGDGDVDDYDCMNLMDFVRGYHLAELTSTGLPRGYWKLGDIRHSQVAVAERAPKIYTRNPYLREFLDDDLPQTLADCPYSSSTKCALDVVFVTANDGMLHAFNKHTGDELWAYVPQNLLGEMAGAEEKAELLNLMKGETLIFDATPRIEYVWIDGYVGEGSFSSSNKDGKQTADEWVRVLLVGQGEGGRYYLALDVTDPQFPYLLWEDTNDTAPVLGMGSTTSTPVAGLVYDQNNSPAYDRWVAFYGSGEGDGDSIEARLYIKALTDLYSISTSAEVYSDTGIKVKVDLDGDGVDDQTGFPSNPTVVDKDNDGDVDEVFLINSSGAMYKFVIKTSDINATTGCLFFDPENARLTQGGTPTRVATRTKAYWAATAAFNSAGQLILYWGTGSPYDLFTTDVGYFYAVVDSEACSEGWLYTECNGTGYMALSAGEKLTGSPVVYARAVYFPTFKPSSDRCSPGEGRLYGLDYQACSPAMDTNDDGTIDSSDRTYTSLGDGMPSSIVIANDSLYVATSDGLLDGDAKNSVNRLDLDNDPFSGTTAIQWRELF